MRDQIDALFGRKMTRKEFLQYVGSALLIVFGVGGLMNALQPKSQTLQKNLGYGSSAYGGVAKRS